MEIRRAWAVARTLLDCSHNLPASSVIGINVWYLLGASYAQAITYIVPN